MENTQTAKVKVASHSVKNCRVTFGALVGFDAKIMSAAREEGTGLKMVVKTETGAIVSASQIYIANGKTYSFQDVGRALEQGDGTFLWIEKAELEACKAPSNPEIAISEFFPLAQVDPIMFDKGYFIAPDPGKVKKGASINPNAQSCIAYASLLDVMKEVGLAAKAKVEFKGKEHNVILRVYNDGTQDLLMLHTIFTSADVRTCEIVRPTIALNDALKGMCKELIASMTTTFDKDAVTSDSDAKFNALVERKRAEIAGTATPNSTPTESSTASVGDDLMAKMAASILQAKMKKTDATTEKVTA
jgi:DNA end-binding protein Ku